MAQPNRGIQSLKAGSAAQVASIVAGFGVQLFTTPYVLMKLGLHDFGVWSITGAIAQYGALFDLGVSRAASRYVAVFHSKGDQRSEGGVVAVCVATLFCVAALLGGLVLATSQLIAPVLGLREPSQAGTLLLVAVAILFVGLLARVLAAASIGRGRTVPPLTAVAIMSALQSVGGVVVLAVEPSLLGFAYGTLGGISLGLVVVVAVILVDEGRITFAVPSWRIAREIFSYGISSQIAALGDLLLFQSGKLVAGALIGPSAAGIYELASRPAMAAQVLGASPGTALMPHLTRIYVAGGVGGILAEYEHLTRRNTSVALAIPFAMAATAMTAIPVWLDGPHLDVVAADRLLRECVDLDLHLHAHGDGSPTDDCQGDGGRRHPPVDRRGARNQVLRIRRPYGGNRDRGTRHQTSGPLANAVERTYPTTVLFSRCPWTLCGGFCRRALGLADWPSGYAAESTLGDNSLRCRLHCIFGNLPSTRLGPRVPPASFESIERPSAD